MFPKITTTVLLCSLLTACGGGASESGAGSQSHASPATSTGEPAPSADHATPAVTQTAPGGTIPARDIATLSTPVTSPPPSLGIDSYYQKYLDADGIPVLATGAVDDQALIKARHIIHTMLAKRKDIRDALVAASSRFMIIPRDKGITTLPEYAYLKRVPAPAGYASWDHRARGMGGLHTSCGEENLMRSSSDPYYGQAICIHEFAHTIQNTGIARADPAFSSRLNDHYSAIRREKFVADTYMAINIGEYWATAVQAWYNGGICRAVPDGIYGPLCDHPSLGQLDPGGYELINRVFNPPPAAALY